LENSLAVLCLHNRAELVSSSWFVQCVHCTVCTLYRLTGLLTWLKPRHIQYTCICLGIDRMSSSSSIKIMLSKQCSGSFQNIPNLFVYETSLIGDSESVRNRQTSDRTVNLRSPQPIGCGLENKNKHSCTAHEQQHLFDRILMSVISSSIFSLFCAIVNLFIFEVK
jgi:hypothetical protein